METEYIARISYGKDSLKMLDVIHSRGLPLDRITTTDVWATDTISANLPPVEAFKTRMDERIFQLYGIKVEHLCARNPDGSKKTYEQMFYHVPVRRSQSLNVERERENRPDSQIVQVERERERSTSKEQSAVSRICGTRGVKLDSNGFPMHRVQGAITGFPPNTRYNWCQKLKIPILGQNQGLAAVQQAPPVVPTSQDTGINGFPTLWVPWCRGGLKINLRQDPFSSERGLTTRKDRNIVEYLGIAADEPKRFGQLNEKKRAPLVEFGIDEDLCGLYCQYNDMLSPSYETSCRDGCWFCHNQGVAQLRHLRKNYPDLWALLMKWDLDSPVSFKADGHTVHDFDRRFQLEDEGFLVPGETFRWSMLDGDLQYRLF